MNHNGAQSSLGIMKIGFDFWMRQKSEPLIPMTLLTFHGISEKPFKSRFHPKPDSQ
jgi:hypothetical protein